MPDFKSFGNILRSFLHKGGCTIHGAAVHATEIVGHCKVGIHAAYKRPVRIIDLSTNFSPAVTAGADT